MPKSKPQSPPPAEPPAPTVTRQTLEETPARVLQFLRGVGTTPAIRALMATRGYEDADHKEGWDLLHAVSGYSASAPPAVVVDAEVRDAIVTLDNEDEGIFRIVGGALRRLHPEQATFVLDGLGPSVGPAAVVGVKKLLARLDELEHGPKRKATRAADHAALATLTKRRFDAKERKRLADLVKVAEKAAAMPADDPDRVARDEERTKGLTALRAWFEDWSGVAHVVVKRRDYKIRLGLAQRKPRAKKAATKAPAAKDAASAATDSTKVTTSATAAADPGKDANGKQALSQ